MNSLKDLLIFTEHDERSSSFTEPASQQNLYVKIYERLHRASSLYGFPNGRFLLSQGNAVFIKCAGLLQLKDICTVFVRPKYMSRTKPLEEVLSELNQIYIVASCSGKKRRDFGETICFSPGDFEMVASKLLTLISACNGKTASLPSEYSYFSHSISGKFDVMDIFLPSSSGFFQLSVNSTYNNIYNRVISYATSLMASVCSAENAVALKRVSMEYGDGTTVDAFSAPDHAPFSQALQSLYQFCKSIITGMDDIDIELRSTSPTFYAMEYLWEDFCLALMRSAFTGKPNFTVHQLSKLLIATSKFRLITGSPDIVVSDTSLADVIQPRLIADAKYKYLDAFSTQTADISDIYQVYSYLITTNTKHALLFYPVDLNSELTLHIHDEVFLQTGHSISVIGINTNKLTPERVALIVRQIQDNPHIMSLNSSNNP
jgi:hypothetical protein